MTATSLDKEKVEGGKEILLGKKMQKLSDKEKGIFRMISLKRRKIDKLGIYVKLFMLGKVVPLFKGVIHSN